MSLFRINLITYSKRISPRCFSSAVQNEESRMIPQYPPILDQSYEKRMERKREAFHDEIKKVKTVEEKQIKLNMPRFYGFKSHVLAEDYIPYNSLTLAQHVTRTHLIVNKELPEYYKKIDVDELMNDLKPQIEEAVRIEFDGYKRKYDDKELSKQEFDDMISSSLCKQITRIVMSRLSSKRDDVKNFQVDHDPRIESTWAVGGMNPPKSIKKMRDNLEWSKPYAKDPVDRIMVYTGSPILTTRSNLPLPFIITPSESENPALEVPFFQYDPRVVVSKTTHRHIANVPGFWPGDAYRFGLLSFHKRGHLHNRVHFQDEEEMKEALHRQAILASYGWLQAQANFLGFTTYNDITYPLVTQTVITNGQLWSFYSYQLNTMVLHTKYIHENPKRNICWGTEEMKLFDEIHDGKIINFNDDVLKALLQLFANTPEERLGINLTPYLSDEEKVAADYEDDDKRQWLEREYKFLVSNRPRHLTFPEYAPWEKIYKIDNKTRFMDKRRTPYDYNIQPQKRTLDDRNPFYIPRKLRPDVPRWKNRYHKEYFP